VLDRIAWPFLRKSVISKSEHDWYMGGIPFEHLKASDGLQMANYWILVQVSIT
jgi:hypothetical protein